MVGKESSRFKKPILIIRIGLFNIETVPEPQNFLFLTDFLKETEGVSETRIYTGGPGGGSSGSRGCSGVAHTKPPLKPRDQVSRFT